MLRRDSAEQLREDGAARYEAQDVVLDEVASRRDVINSVAEQSEGNDTVADHVLQAWSLDDIVADLVVARLLDE